MNRFSQLSTRTWLSLIALGLFFAQIVPLYILDRTEVSQEKREQNPFFQPVHMSDRGNRGSMDSNTSDSSDEPDDGSRIRIPTEHLASYLLANLTGGFKQIAITSLWVKYGRLKEEQRVNEAVALLQLLKVLQPEREQVWSFLNYDIAFNLSRYQPNEKQEWEKVKEAAQIAREGNKRIGGSIKLKFDLSWIYGYRVPQEPHMMHRTWEERGQTNYRIALNHLKEGRVLAKQRGRLDQYLKYYVFMINYGFYDIVMLMEYGKHDRALERISELQEFGETLLDDYRSHDRTIPGPYKVRLASLEDLSELIEADRKLYKTSWDDRKQKINRTKTLLSLWTQFFHDYRGALAKEAGRHVLHRSFELLYYVSKDLEQYYRSGDRSLRKRASRLIQDELNPRTEGLMPGEARMGDGHVEQAHKDLGTFWEQMNTYFENLSALFSTEKEQEKEEIRRRLEEVYAELMDLYRSEHRGFNFKWFKKTIETLESEDVLNY